jgi:hypothetical protein
VPCFEGTAADGGGLSDEVVGEVGVQAQGLVIERMEGAGSEVLDLLEGGDGLPCCDGGHDFGTQFVCVDLVQEPEDSTVGVVEEPEGRYARGSN